MHVNINLSSFIMQLSFRVLLPIQFAHNILATETPSSLMQKSLHDRNSIAKSDAVAGACLELV